MSERIESLKLLIERGGNCRAKHSASAVVKERFEGHPVWDGIVEIFTLEDHPTAKRAYGWVIPPESRGQEPQYITVLGESPVNSAQDAVRASISKDLKDLIRLGRKIKFG